MRESSTNSNKSTAAWRVSCRCPECSAELVIRSNRNDGSRFIACAGFPKCRFSEALDDALEACAARIAALEGELRAERDSTLMMPANAVAKSLRELIALSHPDKWPGNPLAHEVCSRLTDLRARVAA